MKITVKLLAAMMAAVIVCFAFASCSDASGGSTVATSFHEAEKYVSTDFSKVTVEVPDNEPKTMKKVMKDISKGKYDNKVVRIEGTNTRYGDNAGIIQKNDDGTNVGAMYYIINGTFPLDYPDQDAKIRLKGLVVVDENTGARHLEVPKDQIEVIG